MAFPNDSDDFSGSTFPETFWTEVIPSGPEGSITRTGFGTSDAFAVLQVDAGNTHGMWITKDGCALEQGCADQDFTIETKMNLPPSVNIEEAGIYVVNSAESTGVVAGFYYNGGLQYWAASFIAQSAHHDASATALEGDEVWIRLQWDATAEEVTYSWADNAAFTSAETDGPNAMAGFVPNKCGIYVGNEPGNQALSVTEFDYFWEIGAPISPEDPVSGSRRAVIIT